MKSLIHSVRAATVLFPALLLHLSDASSQVPPDKVVDLSLTVSPELPCVWPVGMTPHAVVATRTIGPGPYHRDLIIIDEHTGTQWDAPAHFVPPPDSGLPGAGPNGLLTCDKVPAWQFCGEACVIDLTSRRDEASPGASFLIEPEVVAAWEKEHRPLAFGDVVLFRSGYNDEYYQPFPAGDRFVATALRKETPGWPAPSPDTMTYLGGKGVKTLAIDSPSMGPLPDLAAATHQAGGQLGMIWTECAANLGALPPAGAFYVMLAPRHAGGSGGECRALAVTEPELARRLIESARARRVADLSLVLHEDYPVTWPGYGAGEEASRYVAKTLNAFHKSRGPYFAMAHLLDGQVGTHVVLPSFSLPREGFDRSRYSADVSASLKAFESRYGTLGTSSLTMDQAPLSSLMGRARVIDVRSLAGSTRTDEWPASPLVTVDAVRRFESDSGPIQAGDVVIFRTDHTDRHSLPFPPSPEPEGMMAAPLAGKAEGWPAVASDVIDYLAKKGVRLVGTDAPNLGGVGREQALVTTWLAASRGLFVAEMLTNLGAIEGKDAWFIFAPIKIRGSRGGYGRAIALY